MVLHSAFQANNNQRDFDLHRGNPRLFALLQQILTHDPSGLSLFRLGLRHDQMLLRFAIIDERLSLDEHFFNGGFGNVAVSDLITEDNISVGGNTTPSAIPFYEDLEIKNSLPAQEKSWAFFHNPYLIVCHSMISTNPGGHQMHACAPTNPSAPAETDGNGVQSVNATEPQQGESVADVMGMHNDRNVAALPKKKEPKAALRVRKRKEARRQQSSAAVKKIKERYSCSYENDSSVGEGEDFREREK